MVKLALFEINMTFLFNPFRVEGPFCAWTQSDFEFLLSGWVLYFIETNFVFNPAGVVHACMYTLGSAFGFHPGVTQGYSH
jgi:hypothetical protein